MIHFETVYDLIRDTRKKASEDDLEIEQALDYLLQELYEIENED